ncbi:papain-like cysteine protease family protein [Rhizobium leguminosarum]|uniref:papain-like cysteine protease family protein n=1 Tax=Rhizobium leguminosarum TaxID=384 RepID=UPI001C905D7F|nr:papain-like cysteine protease family protein [Rhizobium leguminosarum]MBY2988299.1 hypothetical protein [Rhizobium leguminosarum]
MNYEVAGTINPVDQNDGALCWLATTATLLSWSFLRPMSLRETANHLGSPFKDYLTSGDPLLARDIPLFLQRSRLISVAGQSRPARAWEALLKAHGPLGVGVDADAPDNYMAHLVTIYGISGDETPKRTNVKLIDPNGGRKITITFEKLAELYGANDAVNTPFNVFHNP